VVEDRPILSAEYRLPLLPTTEPPCSTVSATAELHERSKLIIAIIAVINFDRSTDLHPTDSAHKIRIQHMWILDGSITSIDHSSQISVDTAIIILWIKYYNDRILKIMLSVDELHAVMYILNTHMKTAYKVVW